MRVLREIAATALLSVLAAGALAGDVALIYGDRGQSPFFQSAEGLSSDAFIDPLTKAGFDVIEPERRDPGAMRRAAQDVQKQLDAGEVERLLIVVYGPFAGNARDNWALSNDAISASNITIGATGMSVNALSDMADRAGRGVVMLVPGRAPQSLGSGLAPGLGQITSVGDVTYLTGSAEALVSVLTGGLLHAGKTYAAVADVLPTGVQMDGFVSPATGFMGDASAEGADQLMQAGYWQAIRDVDTIDAYRLYLRAYPKATNRAVAEERITFLKGAPERLARATEDKLTLSRDAKRGIQRDLKLLGHYTAGIDGQFGRGSRAAIAGWQRAGGLDETGYLTGNQLFALRSEAKERQAAIDADAAEQAKLVERKDRAYWRQTGRDGTEAGLRAYLGRYPEGLFADAARAGLVEFDRAREAEEDRARTATWQAAQAGGTAGHYRDFLKAYPTGKYSRKARGELQAIEDSIADQDLAARAQAQEGEIAGSRVARLMIEQRLEQVGAQPGTVDGRFDAQTRDALRWFQDSRAIPVSGYVTRLTMMRLMAGQ